MLDLSLATKEPLKAFTMFKGHWPNSRPGQKSLTFHAWTHLPGKAGLFEQLSKLKRKKANGNGKDQQKSEWSAEKSVRFTLPPSEVRVSHY